MERLAGWGLALRIFVLLELTFGSTLLVSTFLEGGRHVGRGPTVLLALLQPVLAVATFVLVRVVPQLRGKRRRKLAWLLWLLTLPPSYVAVAVGAIADADKPLVALFAMLFGTPMLLPVSLLFAPAIGLSAHAIARATPCSEPRG